MILQYDTCTANGKGDWDLRDGNIKSKKARIIWYPYEKKNRWNKGESLIESYNSYPFLAKNANFLKVIKCM